MSVNPFPTASIPRGETADAERPDIPPQAGVPGQLTSLTLPSSSVGRVDLPLSERVLAGGELTRSTYRIPESESGYMFRRHFA